MNAANRSHTNSKAEFPIGIFDSGFGGLTVVEELSKRLPDENVIFVGDSARCPYGPRDLEEVKNFALEISSYLVDRGCKLIVIACNTATAAGLEAVQQRFNVPVVGVVSPGSRAAVYMTRSRRVGVIATEGTVQSHAYEKAISSLDAGIEVFQLATPQFVEIVESGFNESAEAGRTQMYGDTHGDNFKIIDAELESLKHLDIDTLVLGCTHFPLIEPLIAASMGPDVELVSSAEETAREVHAVLKRRGELAHPDAHGEGKGEGGTGTISILTTADNVDEFNTVAGNVLEGRPFTVATLSL